MNEIASLLKRWQQHGCPDCGGDCASANPPVTSCIMKETAEALSRVAVTDSRAQCDSLIDALKFAHDLAAEELPHAKVGTGAEVALRHIVRKTAEALRTTGIGGEGKP